MALMLELALHAELGTAHASLMPSFTPCSWMGGEGRVGKDSVAKAALNMPGSGAHCSYDVPSQCPYPCHLSSS